MKRALISLMCTGCLLSSLQSANAAADDGPEITMNGHPVQFEDARPTEIQGRIFVPYRKLFETLGAAVSWDSATNTAVAVKDGVTVRLPIGSNVMMVNHKPVTMDVAATVVNNRTMVPIRFVSQSLGAMVEWKAGSGSTRAKIEILLVPNEILGESHIQLQRMIQFVRSNNPTFNPEIAKAYLEVGHTYGIRGDVAFCQAILETGWFRFDGGTAVTPDQNNFCGMGVTGKGLKGNAFPTIKDGVTAHMQHLYAYATTAKIPLGEHLIDPRFSYVTRGIAVNWQDLNRRWASNDLYGQHILELYEQLKAVR